MDFKTKEDEEAYEKFLLLEIACDEHNRKQMQSCDTSHLKKGILNKVNAAPKQWIKLTGAMSKALDKNRKLHKTMRYKLTSKERTWLF